MCEIGKLAFSDISCRNRRFLVRDRHIKAELRRAEAWADVLRYADDRGRQPAADLTGLRQRLAVGQADDRPGKKGIARAGRVDDIDLFGRDRAALAAAAGVDGTLVPHRDYHAGDVGAVYIASQRAAHLVRVQRLIIV